MKHKTASRLVIGIVAILMLLFTLVSLQEGAYIGALMSCVGAVALLVVLGADLARGDWL